MFSKHVVDVYNLIQNDLKDNHPRLVNYCGSTCCITIHCLEEGFYGL